MTGQLYALQRDLDMIAAQVNNLTKVLSDMDLILKRTEDAELEQKFQAAQMRRIEDRLDKVEQRLDKVEQRLDRIEKLLLLVCQKLGINPTI